MKHKIIRVQNIEEVHRYVIRKERDSHRSICGLLNELNFDQESILRVDRVFEESENDLIYLNKNDTDIYLFVTKDFLELVIKTPMNQKRLNKKIEKYFEFVAP